METARKTRSIIAPPIHIPLPRWRPKERAGSGERTVPGVAARPEDQAVAEHFCFECREAMFDRARSTCECTSIASEFARQQVFSGQVACGWFVEGNKRVLKWSICSGRML